MSLKLNERYPARFNNPTAGYPQGSFKNRTTPTAKDGSYLEKDWANDKEGFFQSLLSAAGITANGAVDAVGASQFFDSLQMLKQIQAGTAFTTAGIAGALTLAPTPAISAYSAPLRFRVKFSQSSTGNDTINVSGKGAQNLKQYNSDGAKVAAVFAANQLADVEYDGVDWVLLDPLPPAAGYGGIQSAFSNLKVSAAGTSATVTVTANAICLKNSSNEQIVINALSLAINSAAVGANGLDTGVLAASTWYSVWAIWNGTTSTAAGLLSLSATAPTMPAGFTHKARVGWARTDASANKYLLGFVQNGRTAQYRVAAGSNVPVPPLMASGVQGSPGTPTWVAVSVSSFVPQTASKIRITITGYHQNTNVIAAPNNSYGGVSTTAATSPPFNLSMSAPGAANTSISGDMVLESTNIYYASSSNPGGLMCNGWEDNL